MSNRSLTARRRPGGGDSTAVIKIASVEGEIDVRDEDRGAVEEHDEAEKRQPEDDVAPRELRVGFHRLVHHLRRHRLGQDLVRRGKAGRLYLVVAPTYAMLSDATFRMFLGLAQELGVDIAFQKDNAYRRNRRVVARLQRDRRASWERVCMSQLRAMTAVAALSLFTACMMKDERVPFTPGMRNKAFNAKSLKLARSVANTWSRKSMLPVTA